jgi:hypothetical protein
MLRYVSAMSVAVLLVAPAAKAQSSQAQPAPRRPAAGVEVTGVIVRPIKTRVGEPCPATFTIAGEISTNGPTTVRYTWISPDGHTWPTRDLVFKTGTTQGVNETWTLGAAGKTVKQWIQLQTLAPNNQASTQVALAFTCAK